MSLLTEHVPLGSVPGLIDCELIRSHVRLLVKDLKKWFAVKDPSLVISSINPHSGESGLLGAEEKDVIIPAVEGLRKEGVKIDGPFSPAFALRCALEGRYGVVVSPYHDQLLPAFKVLLGPSVNVTLGLGFPRTSPDHGPAVDTAGKKEADHSSMKAAIGLALELALG